MSFKAIISEKFNAAIWRMEIDEITETIFLELRQNENKQVWFAAMSLSGGSVYFRDLKPAERWLTGIEAAYDGVLLLHSYQSETGPTHKGLVAIDAFSGQMLWSNYNYAFEHLSDQGPVVYDTRMLPRKLFLTHIKTGETFRIYQPTVYTLLKNSIVAPTQLTAEALLLKNIHMHPYGNTAHYLEYNNFRIVSLHLLKGGELTQLLYIMDGERILLEDLLNTSIQKIQPEAFIMHKNRLIYIKNKSVLKVVTL